MIQYSIDDVVLPLYVISIPYTVYSYKRFLLLEFNGKYPRVETVLSLVPKHTHTHTPDWHLHFSILHNIHPIWYVIIRNKFVYMSVYGFRGYSMEICLCMSGKIANEYTRRNECVDFWKNIICGTYIYTRIITRCFIWFLWWKVLD